MNTKKIGTYDWAIETGGNLSPKEKKTFFKMLIKSQVMNQLSILRYKLGLKHAKSIDIDSIIIPDSKIANEAIELATKNYDVHLMNHCFRTYLFGQITAQTEDIDKIDSELLFVGSMLHDIALTPSYSKNNCSCCFATEGAHVAHKLAVENEWEEERSKLLFTSISAHLNPIVNKKIYGRESYLLGAGAIMDVIGNKYHTFDISTLQEINKRYPRKGLNGNFRESIIETMYQKHSPNSRASILVEKGLTVLLKKNPLEKLS